MTSREASEMTALAAKFERAALGFDQIDPHDCLKAADALRRTTARPDAVKPVDEACREALRNLVSALHKVHQHPAYKAIWELRQLHNGSYTGPNYEEEFKAANLVLSALPAPAPPVASEVTDEQCATVCRHLGLAEDTSNFTTLREGFVAAHITAKAKEGK